MTNPNVVSSRGAARGPPLRHLYGENIFVEEDNLTYMVNNNYGLGITMWKYQGSLHRIGGPAVIRANGRWEWWLSGRRVLLYIWAEKLGYTKNQIAMMRKDWESEKLLLKLKSGK